MKYEKQFEEFLNSDYFKDKVKVVKDLIRERFEDYFLFDLEEIIERAKASFSSVTDINLSNIYSKEAISILIEENKIVKIKNSYILMKQFKKIYDFMIIFNDLSNEEKDKLISKILINKI